MSEHDENKEDAQARGWHREKIEGDQIADMVGEERPPSLRRQGRRLGMSRETVRSETSIPNRRSSP